MKKPPCAVIQNILSAIHWNKSWIVRLVKMHTSSNDLFYIINNWSNQTDQNLLKHQRDENDLKSQQHLDKHLFNVYFDFLVWSHLLTWRRVHDLYYSRHVVHLSFCVFLLRCEMKMSCSFFIYIYINTHTHTCVCTAGGGTHLTADSSGQTSWASSVLLLLELRTLTNRKLRENHDLMNVDKTADTQTLFVWYDVTAHQCLSL